MIAGREVSTLAEFEDLVRDALLHLYDAAYLQTHPLATLVGPAPDEGATARAKRLFHALLGAVESLRPAFGTPSDSRIWRSYRILELRYLESLTAGEVIDQLAISKTQYQRDHARALDAVASLLWDSWGLDPARIPVTTDTERQSLALTEVEDLAAAMKREHVDLVEVLSGLVSLLGRSSEGRTIKFAAQPGLPTVYADRVALRQIFLSLLQAALARPGTGALQISLDLRKPYVVLSVVASTRDTAKSPQQSLAAPAAGVRDVGPELEVARRLTEAMDGRLEIGLTGDGAPWRATVTLLPAQRATVLVLDNHPDFINLVARYVAPDGWQVVGATNVAQALTLAMEREPDVVLLDVMMPGQDGWDLLIALNAQPGSHRIPVVVCSVLYEPEVARALGAASYLPKPVTQDALLKALAPYRPPAAVMASSLSPSRG